MPGLVLAAALVADHKTQTARLCPVQVVDFYGDELRYLPKLATERERNDGRAPARTVPGKPAVDILSSLREVRTTHSRSGRSTTCAAGVGEGVVKC